ncbi:hypothetical protein NBRC116590_17320 [Pelagimonas sp. KU-00592-HH]|uniref:LytTR family DNA-binding domain-containing protein n=1 Tax=Pelagimonas sp. KU-00592-HH TaxID=3127651 RepID=UPI0031048AC7
MKTNKAMRPEGNDQQALEVTTMRGRIIRFTLPELRRAVVNFRFSAFVGIGALLFFWFDAHGLSQILTPLPRLLYWLIAAFDTVAIYILAVIAWATCSNRLGFPRVYLPIIPFLTIAPTIVLNRSGLFLATGAPLPPSSEFVTYCVSSLIGVLAFEFLYFEFVQPVLEARYLRYSMDKSEATTPSLALGRSKYSIEDVLFVRSVDHYLEVNLADGSTETVYGKLSEVVQQTETAWGVPTHRSFWVSKNAISEATKQGRKMCLILVNGERIPVAEARQKEIKAWLEEHVPTVRIN